MISRETRAYILSKVVRYVITVFAAIFICFLIPRLAPGDPISSLLARLRTTAGPGGSDVVKHYIERFGLDKDYLTQFLMYLANLFRGDLGPSIMAYPKPVAELIAERLPWTIFLLGSTTVISWIIGNILGAFVGWSKNEKLNAMIVSVCITISQIPFYIFSLVLIYLFVYLIPIFPSSGAKSIFTSPGFNLPFILDVLNHAMLPALSIILVNLGSTIIHMRGLIVSIKGSEFLKFAEAKGLSKKTILMKYAFRNALLPQVTSLGMSLGFILSGSMIVEWVFAYPGIGQLFVNSLTYFDYNVMNAIFLLTIFGVLTANLLLDLLYPLIDPRIKSA
jgi:peptide/nickel transport system permease protein